MKNVPFSQINIGDRSVYKRTVTQGDIDAFAKVSGDSNPMHLSDAFARATPFGGIIAHGMLAASYISTILGTQYPGPGTVFLGLDAVKFLAPVRPGDEITTTLTVTQKHATKPVVTFSCACTNQRGETVLTAEAIVKAPTTSLNLPPLPSGRGPG